MNMAQQWSLHGQVNSDDLMYSRCRPAMADFDWAEATDIIPSMAGLVPEPGESSIRLQCLPLASLVLAMGNPTVHYFSLDIEGAELQVQRTINI